MKRGISAGVALTAFVAVRGPGPRAPSSPRPAGGDDGPRYSNGNEPDSSRQLSRVGVPQLEPRLELSAPREPPPAPPRFDNVFVNPSSYRASCKPASGPTGRSSSSSSDSPPRRPRRTRPESSRPSLGSRSGGEGLAVPGWLGLLQLRSGRTVECRRPAAVRRHRRPLHRLPHEAHGRRTHVRPVLSDAVRGSQAPGHGETDYTDP